MKAPLTFYDVICKESKTNKISQLRAMEILAEEPEKLRETIRRRKDAQKSFFS